MLYLEHLFKNIKNMVIRRGFAEGWNFTLNKFVLFFVTILVLINLYGGKLYKYNFLIKFTYSEYKEEHFIRYEEQNT